MALSATIFKAEIQISDIDRHYYQTHSLTIAQHPSETTERLMIRVLAFVMYAHERLSFGRGISVQDEPDLAQKDLTGVLEHWIDVGQPDEARIRRACSRAQAVTIITYAGRNTETWWDKIAPALARFKNLRVFNVPVASSLALATFAQRSMQLQCLIQDGLIEISTGERTVSIEGTMLRTPG